MLQTRDPALEAAKRKTLRFVLAVVFVMTLAAWAMVPLYRLVCQHYGISTVAQRASLPLAPIGKRLVHVRFLGISQLGTDIRFQPLVSQISVHVGQIRKVRYRFTNLTNHLIQFQAVHSVSPPSADADFHKIMCFCFTRQSLKPHQTKTMPIEFWIDPKLAPETTSISLQYSLFALHPDRADLPEAGHS